MTLVISQINVEGCHTKDNHDAIQYRDWRSNTKDIPYALHRDSKLKDINFLSTLHHLRRTLEKQKEIKEFKEQRFELNSTIQQQKQKQHTEVIWKKHPVLLIIKSQLTRENENQSMSKNNKTCSRWMPVSLTIRWQRQTKGTCELKITFLLLSLILISKMYKQTWLVNFHLILISGIYIYLCN